MKESGLPCNCNECNVDVSSGNVREFAFMVSKGVWVVAAPNDTHAMEYFLCIGCLEQRIGRKLVSTDFPPEIPLNWHGMFERSARLLERMGHTEVKL